MGKKKEFLQWARNKRKGRGLSQSPWEAASRRPYPREWKPGQFWDQRALQGTRVSPFLASPVVLCGWQSLCSSWALRGRRASQVALVVMNQPANAGDTVRHNFNPSVGKISWRRSWQPTPVFLPGESPGQRSLEGYIPSRHNEPDMTEWFSMYACRVVYKWFSCQSSIFTANSKGTRLRHQWTYWQWTYRPKKRCVPGRSTKGKSRSWY